MNGPRQAAICALSCYFAGAPGRIRTRDPLLRRHIRTVAGHRLASPYETSSWTNHPGVSPCVARHLPPVAPLLAPRDLATLAHVRVNSGAEYHLAPRRFR